MYFYGCSKSLSKTICIVLLTIICLTMFVIPNNTVSAETVFSDVKDEEEFWFYPVYWGAANKIVEGYKDGSFRPTNKCTRAQMVTFIWRMAGKPNPKTSKNPFKDITKSDYWYKAALWGNENGIVMGYKDGSFGPQKLCTRAQAVTFLWRLAGKPDPANKTNIFSDIDKGDYYYKAVLWASDSKIVAGYDNGTFRPAGNCLRRQMVTFLHKFFKATKNGVVKPIKINPSLTDDYKIGVPTVWSLKGLSAEQVFDQLLPLLEVSSGDLSDDYGKRFPVTPNSELSNFYEFNSSKNKENYIYRVCPYIEIEMDGTYTVEYKSNVGIILNLDGSYKRAEKFYSLVYDYICKEIPFEEYPPEDGFDPSEYRNNRHDDRTGSSWSSWTGDCSISMNRRQGGPNQQVIYSINIRLPIKNRPQK